jgi:hypothetical protein
MTHFNSLYLVIVVSLLLMPSLVGAQDREISKDELQRIKQAAQTEGWSAFAKATTEAKMLERYASVQGAKYVKKNQLYTDATGVLGGCTDPPGCLEGSVARRATTNLFLDKTDQLMNYRAAAEGTRSAVSEIILREARSIGVTLAPDQVDNIANDAIDQYQPSGLLMAGVASTEVLASAFSMAFGGGAAVKSANLAQAAVGTSRVAKLAKVAQGAEKFTLGAIKKSTETGVTSTAGELAVRTVVNVARSTTTVSGVSGGAAAGDVTEVTVQLGAHTASKVLTGSKVIEGVAKKADSVGRNLVDKIGGTKLPTFVRVVNPVSGKSELVASETVSVIKYVTADMILSMSQGVTGAVQSLVKGASKAVERVGLAPIVRTGGNTIVPVVRVIVTKTESKASKSVEKKAIENVLALVSSIGSERIAPISQETCSGGDCFLAKFHKDVATGDNVIVYSPKSCAVGERCVDLWLRYPCEISIESCSAVPEYIFRADDRGYTAGKAEDSERVVATGDLLSSLDNEYCDDQTGSCWPPEEQPNAICS